MKTATLLPVTCVLIALISNGLSAQTVREERGWSAQTEGRHYMVAFPEVWAESSEKPTARPMVLYLASHYDTKVRITTPSPTNTNPGISKTVDLVKGQALTVPIDQLYLNKASQTRTGFGIEIVGDHPFSVFTYQSWMGNGEMTRHLPVDAWGRSYYTMNFYQDRYGELSLGYDYRPSQILIVAAHDNTVVSIVPTFGTEGGADLPPIKKGSSGSIQLNKGETFLIKAEIDEDETKSFVSDLSGTIISANQPVAVVSGHTKVAIMRYPDLIPPVPYGAMLGSIVRNNIHDVMLPLDYAATDFITIPCMYTGNRVLTTSDMGLEDIRGDVIRFIATEDNTTIQAMRRDGGGLKTVMKLNRGQSWLETSIETATYWTSNKPIMVGQYGKSYARLAPVGSLKSDDAEPQGGPRVESGMPMLMTVPPIERWINSGTFMAPEGMDNFVNIVFVDGDDLKIRMDGLTLATNYGGAKRPITGTPYAYIRTGIGAGSHVLESDSSNVRWMAWTYGSLDGLDAGRAYGTPIGVSINTTCSDTIDVAETRECGQVTADVTLRSGNNACSRVSDVYAESLTNYVFTNGTPFSLRVIDPQRDAAATVMIRSSSGNFVRKTYTFTAEKISTTPTSVDLGKQAVNTQRCSTIVFTNQQSDKPLVVDGLRAQRSPASFSFSPSSFTIPPGGSVDVQVCVSLSKEGRLTDTVLASLSCADVSTTEFVLNAEEPVIYASDVTWVNVPWESPGIMKYGEIINDSDVELVIHNYDSTLLRGNFVPVSGFELPIVIRGRSRHQYGVMYSPSRVPGAPHMVAFPWYSTASKQDSISIWNGNFTTSVHEDGEHEQIVFYPNPLRRSEASGLQINGLTSPSLVQVFDDLGRSVASTSVGPGSTILPAHVFAGNGVYSIVVQTNESEVTRFRIIVLE